MFINVEPELFQIRKKESSEHKSFSLSNPYWIDTQNYRDKDKLGIDDNVNEFISSIIRTKMGVRKGIVGLVSNFGNGKSFFLQYVYCKLFEALKPIQNENSQDKDGEQSDDKSKIFPIFVDISKFESEKNEMLLLILSEIMRQFEMIANSDISAAHEVKKKLLKLIPKAAKVVSTGVLDMFFQNGKDMMISAISELSEEFGIQLISSLNEEEGFLEELENLTEEHNMIVFLDNLDRCRPEFVLDLLVLLQRLFNVNNILFILAYDKQQIINLLQSKYGPNVDIQSYIKKYIVYEHYMTIPINNFWNMMKAFSGIDYSFKKGKSTTFSDIIDDKELEDKKKNKILLSYMWQIVFKKTTLSLRKFQQGFTSINFSADKIDLDIEKQIIFIELLYIKSTFPLEYQYIHHYLDDIIYQGAFPLSFFRELKDIESVLYNKSGISGRETFKTIAKNNKMLVKNMLDSLELRGS